ncbi:uncharacterized protein LOC100883688 [Megachile rotundata]|uniref:uncharacterized protein LOC100883688 n=1 Tax=Megachile rotundata TaxID=143995 RepID=UPI003FD0E573
MRCLVDSIAVSARGSSTISSITFDGIPLAPKYLNILCCGLKDNENLKALSLTRCRIGDVGCNLLLGCLRNVPNLCVLNLSSCRLTNRSAMFLSVFLKRKKADLLQNVWEKSSLRSGEENPCDRVQGLHTLILDKNPKFSDNGVQQLAYALKTDFWLKNLNLKHCGITKHGGEIIIKLLKSNSSITRMDLTENQIPINTLQIIFRMLKRKRESVESMTLKKKLALHWRHSQNKILQNETCKSYRRTGKGSANRLSKINRRSLQNHRLKTVRFERKVDKAKKIETELQSEKSNGSRGDKLRDLESQLFSIIESNCKLKEKLLSNKELLSVEAQETLRMEDELQRISFRLNDLKNKVIALNIVSSKTSGELHLMEGLRYAFEKMQALSTATEIEVI